MWFAANLSIHRENAFKTVSSMHTHTHTGVLPELLRDSVFPTCLPGHLYTPGR